MPSAEFQHFTALFFAADESGDTFPRLHAALHHLVPDERQQAEALLLQHLPEARAIFSAGSLRCQRASAPLKTLLPQQNGRMRVLVAQALWRIEMLPEAATHLFDVLQYDWIWENRMHAALALGEVPYAETAQTLMKALNDEAAPVRYYAANALLIIHGIGNWRVLPPDQRHPLIVHIWSPRLDVRQHGIVQLYDVLKREGTSLVTMT